MPADDEDGHGSGQDDGAGSSTGEDRASSGSRRGPAPAATTTSHATASPAAARWGATRVLSATVRRSAPARAPATRRRPRRPGQQQARASWPGASCGHHEGGPEREQPHLGVRRGGGDLDARVGRRAVGERDAGQGSSGASARYTATPCGGVGGHQGERRGRASPRRPTPRAATGSPRPGGRWALDPDRAQHPLEHRRGGCSTRSRTSDHTVSSRAGPTCGSSSVRQSGQATRCCSTEAARTLPSAPSAYRPARSGSRCHGVVVMPVPSAVRDGRASSGS